MDLKQFCDLPRPERRELWKRAFLLATRDWRAWLGFVPLSLAMVVLPGVPEGWARNLALFVAIFIGCLTWAWRINSHLQRLV